MKVELEDILAVKPGALRIHRVLALRINGKSPALSALDALRKDHPDDFAKIMRVARLLSENESVTNPEHVKRGAGDLKDIYEMRGGQARLFFFHDPVSRALVVCTNLYWKAKPSRREQTQAFELAMKLRHIYIAYTHGGSMK